MCCRLATNDNRDRLGAAEDVAIEFLRRLRNDYFRMLALSGHVLLRGREVQVSLACKDLMEVAR